MTNKKYKRVLALLLALVLLAPSSFGLEKSRVKKEEIIYAGLDFQGRTDLLIAVNGFPRGFKGKDYGKYSQVSNLSTSEELVYDGIKIDIDARENFYYQGKMEARELPWLIEMSWFLDGKRVSEEELLGASGHLKLLYEVKKNPRDKSNYYDYYILQASFNFDVDQVTNLRAEQGTLAAAGSTKMVNFMSLPGRGGTYSIEADIKGYEPGMVQIGALPLSMDLDLSEFSDYTGDLKTLELAISQLNTGTWSFLDGLSQLTQGSASYKEGGPKVLEGAQDLSGGLKEISSGSQGFNQGLEEYSQGMESFQEGMGELLKGLDDFKKGLKELADGSGELSQGAEAIGEGLEELSSNSGVLLDASENFRSFFLGLSEIGNIEISDQELGLLRDTLEFVNKNVLPHLDEVDKDELEKSLYELRNILEKIRELVGNLENILDGLRNPQDYPQGEEEDGELIDRVSQYFKGQIAQRAQELEIEIDYAEALLEALELQISFIDYFLTNIDKLEGSLEGFKSILSELLNLMADGEKMEMVRELLSNLGNLGKGYEEFHQGLVLYMGGVDLISQNFSGQGGFKEGVDLLSDGLAQMNSGFSAFDLGELRGGVGELVRGAGELSGNYSDFNRGLGSLSDGLSDFTLGLDQYIHGFWPLHRGLEELYLGGLELGSGTSQMADETRDIDEKMLEEIKKELDSFTGKGVEFKSFVDYKNKDIASVQFIMLYEGRSLPVEEVDNGVEKEKNLWDRFIDLFKKR